MRKRNGGGGRIEGKKEHTERGVGEIEEEKVGKGIGLREGGRGNIAEEVGEIEKGEVRRGIELKEGGRGNRAGEREEKEKRVGVRGRKGKREVNMSADKRHKEKGDMIVCS